MGTCTPVQEQSFGFEMLVALKFPNWLHGSGTLVQPIGRVLPFYLFCMFVLPLMPASHRRHGALLDRVCSDVAPMMG